MPRDVNGSTQPLPGTIVSQGDTILPSQHNPMVNDVYAMMAQSLSRDGQGGMRAPLNMSGFAIQNVGNATSDTDAASLGQARANGVPIGTVVDFAGTTPPEKWMLCYGQAISRTTYSDLFIAIGGTTYGPGDGSTTFNLPDFRGRVGAGKDDMGGTNAARLSNTYGSVSQSLGAVLGSSSVTLTEAQMPTHTHTATVADPGHTHSTVAGTIVNAGGTGSGNLVLGFNSTTGGSFTGISVSIASKGSSNGHPNAQPTIIMNKIIKVSY